MTKRIVMNLLADRPIAYHPDIARVAGGVKAGIFLSQLLYWSDKGKRGDGYIWKTQSEWEEETALTRREQESARKILKSKGLLLEKRQGIPAKLYYKIGTDILYTLLDELYAQASMHESAIQDVTEAPNRDAPKRQSITESTTETTTKNTTDNIYINDGIATDSALAPIVDALDLVAREEMRLGRDGKIENEDKFYDVALTIHSEGGTPELVKGFGAYWEINCWYDPPSAPALKTIKNDWRKYTETTTKKENIFASNGSLQI